MKRKILVTGGAGFVGSHLCEALSKDDNCEIYSLDNYFTGTESNHVKNVNYIKGCTSEIFNLIDFKPDLIYHLGEYSRVEQSFEDIELVLKYNKLGILSILEFVRKNKSRLIYAGSSTKFGDNGEGKDSSPYAWSKSSNTELVKNYGKWFNIDYAITYFYNVYGDREISSGKYATIIGSFIEKKKKGEKLTVVSPGTQVRNFTHIEDIIRALILIGKDGKGDGYGIGSEKGYSILEVAQLFGGDYIMLPERKGNRMSAPVITEKIKALGWLSNGDLEEYIKSKI